MTPRLPRAFGRYILFDEIGRGGMAEAYLARASTEAGASRHVVVKQILPEYAGRPDFADMLVKEAKLAAKLNHKNIVQVLDLGRTSDAADGELFIAMEYVEGYDLAALLKRCSKDRIPLPPEFALHIVMETLAGLDYAHRSGVVHRDVSPSNVLISFEGEVKVCDFGIARATESVVADGESESIKGKAGYMSPEQARGEPIDGRADAFAAGILLWEMFAGRKLYTSKAGSLLEQARKAEIPDLPEKEVPEREKLAAIVKKALAPAKEDRYASAAAMLRELEDFVRAAKLPASAIKVGDWLSEHFGVEMIDKRRARERAAQAIAKGPAVVLKAIKTPEPAAAHENDPNEPVPASLVATSMDVPAAQQSTPALVRESSPPETKNKLNPWIWVAVALAILGALWFALHR